jgi:hypothetical protein
MKNFEHYDIFNNLIKVNDFVVSNWYGNDLQVCVVTKINPKMIKLRKVVSNSKTFKNKYPKECLKVNSDDVTMYILGNKHV